MPSFYIPNTIFSFFGGIISAYILFKLFKGTVNCLKVFTCGREVAGGVCFKKLGKWAVVTGATDGIGKAYAEELADEGMDVVLISRSQEKLDKVAAEIRENSSVQVKTIAADFSRTDIYEEIEQGLKGLDIGVLVNNVGVSYTYPENFVDYPEESHQQMLMVNCLSVVKMMAMVLPLMKEKALGAVINVSSASAITPTALLATYSASKVFVHFLSTAVNKELFFANYPNIIIQSVTPFFVKTKLAGIRKSSFFVPEPNYFVRSALNTVGVWEHTYGCLAHELQAAAMSVVPAFLVRIIFYRQLSANRARYLKKNKKSN